MYAVQEKNQGPVMTLQNPFNPYWSTLTRAFRNMVAIGQRENTRISPPCPNFPGRKAET